MAGGAEKFSDFSLTDAIVGRLKEEAESITLVNENNDILCPSLLAIIS